MEKNRTMGPEAVDGYLEECKRLGFDIVELSSGFISIPDDDLVRLVEKVRNLGMLPMLEVGIQFGAWRPWRPDKRRCNTAGDRLFNPRFIRPSEQGNRLPP
jgi:phosphosulfolactate synthase (CoM biosynthesis protein A)